MKYYSNTKTIIQPLNSVLLIHWPFARTCQLWFFN